MHTHYSYLSNPSFSRYHHIARCIERLQIHYGGEIAAPYKVHVESTVQLRKIETAITGTEQYSVLLYSSVETSE